MQINVGSFREARAGILQQIPPLTPDSTMFTTHQNTRCKLSHLPKYHHSPEYTLSIVASPKIPPLTRIHAVNCRISQNTTTHQNTQYTLSIVASPKIPPLTRIHAVNCRISQNTTTHQNTRCELLHLPKYHHSPEYTL